MIGYVTLGTTDIARAARFYDAIAKELDTPRMMGSEDEGMIAWATPGGPPGIEVLSPFDGKAPTVGNGTMVALRAADKAQVRRLHTIALEQGGSCEGEPGPRQNGVFYAAYFRDPDGHKLNAFVMGA